MNKIKELLLENTGRHMLDSGGAYGRHWERNQFRDFDAEPATTLDVTWCREGDKFRPQVTHNVYHWLNERVSFDPEMNQRWLDFCEANDESTLSLAAMEAFVESLDAAGLYGEGEPLVVNTYNGECCLSQVLQYTYFSTDEGDFVLLQIHGGCDVRGGYTGAQVFRAEDSLFDNACATIYADGDAPLWENPHWRTDDSYNWYFEDAYGAGAGKPLHEYRVSFDPAHKGDGEHVYVDEDNNIAYCPLSGLPLKAST